jgi:Arc/MetJ-type ribon-helix-helix transcriptional regulator
MTQKTETVNVRVPDEIAVWIDSLVEKKLFSSRSEVVRHFVREYVQEQKRNSSNISSSNFSNSKSKEGNL